MDDNYGDTVARFTIAKIRGLLIRMPYLQPLRKRLLLKKQRTELMEWETHGRPVPPPHLIKQITLRTYSEDYNLKVFIETGTYYGDMVDALKGSFDSIISIELSPKLFKIAKRRFRSVEHIRIIRGDSAEELGKIIATIDRPILFWLDGHYSAGVTEMAKKETPIYEELEHILREKQKRYVILIDDARCFGTSPDYPTLGEIERLVRAYRGDLEMTVRDDIIRIVPRGPSRLARFGEYLP